MRVRDGLTLPVVEIPRVGWRWDLVHRVTAGAFCRKGYVGKAPCVSIPLVQLGRPTHRDRKSLLHLQQATMEPRTDQAPKGGKLAKFKAKVKTVIQRVKVRGVNPQVDHPQNFSCLSAHFGSDLGWSSRPPGDALGLGLPVSESRLSPAHHRFHAA